MTGDGFSPPSDNKQLSFPPLLMSLDRESHDLKGDDCSQLSRPSSLCGSRVWMKTGGDGWSEWTEMMKMAMVAAPLQFLFPPLFHRSLALNFRTNPCQILNRKQEGGYLGARWSMAFLPSSGDEQLLQDGADLVKTLLGSPFLPPDGSGVRRCVRRPQ